MKKRSSLSRFLTGFLTIILWVTLLNFMIIFYAKINSNIVINSSFMISTLFQLIFTVVCLYMIYQLRYITCNIVKGNTFCHINIKKFRAIGKCIVIIGVLDTLANIHNNTGTMLISIFGWSIKPTILIYIILASLAFILAEIFEDAVHIKEENELTI